MEAEEHFYKLSFAQRLIWRLVVACLAVIITSAFLLLLFYGIHVLAEQMGATRYRFRMPVFVIFLPIIAFFVGWKQAKILQPFLSMLFKHSLYFRIFVFGTIFYSVSLSAYIEIFEPMNFRRGLDFRRLDLNGRFGDFLKLLLFPPSLLAFGLILARKVKPKKD